MFFPARRHRGRRCAVFLCAAVSLVPIYCSAADDYQAPIVEVIAFDYKELALMEVERDKLATNIAGLVVNELSKRKTGRQMANARRLIGLALHLSPKNRTALVANFQMKRDVAPKKVEVDYRPEVLSTLLSERAISLRKKGGADNVKLAGFLLFAAVEADTLNENAVYEYELYRLDVGELNWDIITDASREKSAISKQ
jgi:hypothetical protein